MALARAGMHCPAGTFSQQVPGRCKDLVKPALTAADSAFPGRAGRSMELRCLLSLCVFTNQFAALQGEKINSKPPSEQVTHILYDPILIF